MHFMAYLAAAAIAAFAVIELNYSKFRDDGPRAILLIAKILGPIILVGMLGLVLTTLGSFGVWAGLFLLLAFFLGGGVGQITSMALMPFASYLVPVGLIVCPLLFFYIDIVA